ncbi:S8 family serine peptidase [Streptomyces profundus]|uniref:S8 family serine peptidase n=1 Tax=Streptomyces profundus TaxID=2867410 RepID=UPI001D16B3D9|nr:S8 family serine peptidase [Streptomyces sp. MA3_2.13]UED83398.1 S8 family serine peptidase [Streptomyces sp. MA3_2.13]
MRGRSTVVVVALLVVVAGPVPLPGVAGPAAAAEPCRTQAGGEELPDGAGRYPLIDQLGLPQAWDLATGEGVTVAVVDSGVDATHPDLAGAVAQGSEFAGVADEREFERTTPPPEQDCLGHGTALAGLIAAGRAEGDRIAGVAPGASVHPIRVADGVDQATPGLLAAAIDEAVASGAGVLNLSFARPHDDDAVREAIADALTADVVVVAAMGNESGQGPTGGRMYPAAYDDVIAVAAVDAEGAPLDTSNSGPWVDLAGYGQDLPVVAPGGSGYRVEGGTSMATAQVSATAALVRSRFPGLTADEVGRRLTGSATPLGGDVNDRTGAGLVDPFGALTHLGGGATQADPADPADPADTAVSPGYIPVRAVPTAEPPLDSATATALAWSGALLLAVVLGLLAAPGVRRSVRRGWRPGRPEELVAPRARANDPPPAAGLARLAGEAPVPSPHSPERSRTP